MELKYKTATYRVRGFIEAICHRCGLANRSNEDAHRK